MLLVSNVLKPSFVHAILEQHRDMNPSGKFSFEEHDSIIRYIENICALLLLIVGHLKHILGPPTILKQAFVLETKTPQLHFILLAAVKKLEMC